MTDALRTDFAPLLDIRRAAVVGASDRGPGYTLLENLSAHGGEVIGVHPKREEAAGHRCVPSIADVPFKPDVVSIALGARTIVPALEEAIAAGHRVFSIPGLGAEAAGEEGDIARAAVRERLIAADAVCVGINCMGIAVPQRPSPWMGTVCSGFRDGGVAAIVGSGSIGEAVLALGPRVGFRSVVSIGSETSRDAADWLAFHVEDERTRAIGLFLEAVRRPAAFRAALERAADAGKPVVILKVGRSEVAARNAMAHTGAIVGSDQSFDALCRSYGAIRVDDYGDWLEQLEVLGTPRRPRGLRTVLLTNSGGEAELVADVSDAAGMPLMTLPADLAAEIDAAWPFHGVHNPIDYWAFGEPEEIVPDIVRRCAQHPDVDNVVINIDQSWRFENGERENAEHACTSMADIALETDAFCAVLSTAVSDPSDTCVTNAARGGVPVLIGAGMGMRAIARAAQWRPTKPEAPAPWEKPSCPELEREAGHLAEADAKAVLARYGVRAPREIRAANPTEAHAAAAEINATVVVKVDGPAHKEKYGGVILGCTDPDRAAAAAEKIGAPVLVCEEIRGGAEVLCGLVRDPLYGPVVVVGVGGSWAEAVGDTARAGLGPISQADAERLVRTVGPLKHRLADAEVTIVAETLVALGRVAHDFPRVSEIDVNPLVIRDGSGVALDGLIVLSDD
ncbi:MAG: acetate--CoA ligase family protein [Actinobacteria bacterium]|nr:acetate--CoA ligase family protein [Actinomycetota bacterium]